MKDSPNLDLLRSVAVGIVVFSHIALSLKLMPGVDVELFGRMGVVIFFVHTSLVLMLSLERRAEGALSFYIRRAFRIYPLALAIASLMALGAWLGGQPITVRQVWSNLLLVQNVTGDLSLMPPMWSLPYEVQMYLVLPVLFVAARRGGPLQVAGLWLASAAAVTALMAAGLDYHLLQYVPCFLAGILAYTLRRRGAISPIVLFAAVAAGVVVSVIAADVALAVVASGVALPASIAWVAKLPELLILWVFSLALGLLIPMCREISSVATAKGAHLVAKYSYGIYLTHMIATNAAFDQLPDAPWPVRWALFVFILVAAARVAYRWVEAPGIRLGVRLASRFAAARPATAAA
jgi:peptidoglycan/LPS O-acetylase OafA/YrhL